MTKPSSPLRTALLLASAVALAATAGCARVRDTQGYIVDEELVKSVQPGVDNKESVSRALGRPTLTSQWADDAWYYVSRSTRQYAFLKSSPSDQTMLIVRFDADGNVKTVEQRGMEQVADIVPHGDKTETLGRDSGLLEDLFGNIGQVGTAGMGGGGGPQ